MNPRFFKGCIGSKDVARNICEALGVGRVFPTVYTLWAFPHAMKHLLTFSEVSPKVGRCKLTLSNTR